ncbi:MAG: CHAP domain-containing protein [Actinobacteria bacterium]|uniref:Unannotated protein n=1 Tax=freshwater metagenome TaxID=449393 RepID=A0A6J6QK81_9ZZZZ|nr:CHAP domain-containing protein [Actinomycetota bacterium]
MISALVASVPSLPTASATSTYLCSGYTSCADAGYSHFGYRTEGSQMWWRMYSGHNCTNYVAYRMVQNGMSSERPWSGNGNAENWGLAMADITDRTPMVGAVAWWKANVPGAGSNGHVAYVEKVVSRTEIIISEDSWSGDFHWRRIEKDGGSWPSGFIHFADRAVELEDPPVITGNVAVGEALTATTGDWSPAGSYDFQWYAAGQPIAGATERTFVPSPAQRKMRLSVGVAAQRRGYLPGEATSPRTAKVALGTLAISDRPVLSGLARVDETLSVAGGGWSPEPDSTRIQWYADGEPIEGATESSLHLRQGQIRQRITATITASREGYRDSVLTSEASEPVQAGRFEITEPFTVAGRLRVGRVLTVTPGSYEPRDADVAYTWLRNGAEIDGAHAATYQLTPQDVGKSITVRADLTRAGYRDESVLMTTEGRVTTKPELTVQADGKAGKVVVRLRVTAPGVEQPGGPVTVSIGRHEVSGELVDGVVRLVLSGIEPGKHQLRVVYAGTSVVEAAREVVQVKVLRPEK